MNTDGHALLKTSRSCHPERTREGSGVLVMERRCFGVPQHDNRRGFQQSMFICVHLWFHHPNRPLMNDSVRESFGVVNISDVGPSSTSCPRSRKTVRSATRAACWILCVTITSV